MNPTQNILFKLIFSKHRKGIQLKQSYIASFNFQTLMKSEYNIWVQKVIL